jgi:hypothetical protein
MCVRRSGGADTGTGPSYSCETRPAECSAAIDCDLGSCASQAACISALCGVSSFGVALSNHARTVDCADP